MARSSKRVTRKSKKSDFSVDYSRFLQPQIFGGLLLVLAGVTVLTLLFPGGSLGSQWNVLLKLSFGWGAFLAPLLFLSFGLGLVWQHLDSNYSLRWQEASGWLLLFVVLLALLQVVAPNPDPGSAALSGGGYAGRVIYQGLAGAVGELGTLAALIAAIAVGLCLTFSVSPNQLLAMAYSAGRSVISFYRDVLFAPVKGDRGREADVREREIEHLPPSLPKISKPSPPVQSLPISATTQKPKQESPVASTAPVVRGDWQLPPITLLEAPARGELSIADAHQKAKIIEDTLTDFNVQARVVTVNHGPAVTQFGVEPGFHETRDRYGNVVRREKVKVSEITSLSNDLALALSAPSLRIEAPVPGRGVVGIEVPNSSTALVSLRAGVESDRFQKLKAKSKLAIALGEDVSGQAVVGDLAKMPHLLIAGATGSGKSVCLNALIACLLLHTTPDELRLLMIDPKRVELTQFNDAPHLLRPVVVEVEKAVNVLKWVTFEMDERLKRFEKERVRNIDEFNKAAAKRDEPQMHYIVVIVDELADLMMKAPEEVEHTICRLAQLARATGIHLVIATQRPSVDVITGLIKANFPTRISFTMTTQVDSRTILDMAGAEKLLGRGDMLYMPSDAAKPMRLQGAYVSDKEIEAIVSFWTGQGPAKYVDTLMNVESWSPDGAADGRDDLYEKAVDLAHQHNHVSTSLLQRRLRIGYSRAARLIDKMEEEGIVGPSEGGKSREVLAKEETGSAIDEANTALETL
ncbi:MAG: DNA translocase FtsK [Chloroflexi bacterium]|nr:DNA translocase FtsK [Chloroflexota bacterium]